MDINIVVPPFDAQRFTGGIWCVLQHAQQLGQRGHRVRVVCTHPSVLPQWYPKPWAFQVVTLEPRQALQGCLRALFRAAWAALNYARQRGKPGAAACEAQVREQFGTLAQALGRFGTHGLRLGSALEHLKRVLPPADITLATDAETAWPVCLLGTGKLAYFAQHYEPYFWKERLGGEASRRESEASYQLGLNPLANSPWLQARLQALQHDRHVHLCPNAIDHAVFQGLPAQRTPDQPLKIISYGGREAEWKGFVDLCRALRLLQSEHPALRFEWSVYGTALLPPDNAIFAYQPLGFLNPPALAAAYREHHVLLSASWYESFPLFPLEAMACGLAVITTQAGTELFAEHLETALVVTPRDPACISQAVLALSNDEALRQKLARQGQARSRSFTWQRAGDDLERALMAVAAQPESTLKP